MVPVSRAGAGSGAQHRLRCTVPEHRDLERSGLASARSLALPGPVCLFLQQNTVRGERGCRCRAAPLLPTHQRSN